MYLESFRHLIEVEALKAQNQNELGLIAKENKRISDLERLRATKIQELETLEQNFGSLKLTEKQLEIETFNAKLKRMKSQMDLVTSQKEQQALEGQIALLEKELQVQEENYFLNLERSEEIEQEKEDHNQFIAGSLATINSIGSEVEITVKKHQERIHQNNLRIHSLFEQIDKSLAGIYQSIEKKFPPPLRAVAYLVDKKCSQCHMLQDSMLKLSLEEGRSIETCQTCGRLLIPETAKIY